MNTRIDALQSLLGDAAAAFMAAHWPERPFVAHRTLEELPDVLRPALLREPTQLTRVYRGSVEVTNGQRGQYRLSGADPSVYFDVLGLAARFSELESYLPSAQPWLRALERDLGVPEGAAALYAFINAEHIGLAAHCDPTEHIAIQLAGTKTFRYRANPLSRHAAMSHSALLEPTRSALAQSPHGLPSWPQLPDDAESVTLAPGSVLFLPRGVYHETRGGPGGRSVTLVIQVATPSHAQLLARYLTDYLLQSEAWRAPAAGAWAAEPATRAAALARLERLVSELASGEHSLSAEHMVRHAEGGAASQAFEWGAQLQRNQAVPVRLSGSGDTLVITAGDKQVSLAGKTRPVLGWLLERTERFDLSDLARAFADWDERTLVALCRFLVASRALLVFPVQRYPSRSAAAT
jgi:ribosomal protein L16 Arg81 hydroxylase